jgi:hypothetical protein
MFGMLVFETLTGKVPFFADSASTATRKILDGERPPRPADAALDAGTAPLWALHVECTARDPAARPALAAIVPRLDALLAREVPAVAPLAGGTAGAQYSMRDSRALYMCAHV